MRSPSHNGENRDAFEGWKPVEEAGSAAAPRSMREIIPAFRAGLRVGCDRRLW
jgi:hypothetical protein